MNSIYNIADLSVALTCFGDMTKLRALPYQGNCSAPADMTIESSLTPSIQPVRPLQECRVSTRKDGMISYQTELDRWRHSYLSDGTIKQHCAADTKSRQTKYEFAGIFAPYPDFSMQQWEYSYTGTTFACYLMEFSGFVLHASAVLLDGQAVLFSAPSGTGKSTQVSLWQEYFGKERTRILNDDKPPIRRLNETFYAYGSPWSGKHDLSTSTRAPLKAIVFLNQADHNSIHRLPGKQALSMLLYQGVKSRSPDRMSRLLSLLDTLLSEIPVYHLDCTISQEAVETAYRTIFKNED